LAFLDADVDFHRCLVCTYRVLVQVVFLFFVVEVRDLKCGIFFLGVILSSCFSLLSSVILGAEFFLVFFYVLVVDDLMFVSVLSCSVGGDCMDQICNTKLHNLCD
jgi:hypothetical protein